MKPIVQKTLLYTMIGSLLALAATIVLLVTRMLPGGIQDEIVLTTLIGSGATACLLVGALLWERHVFHPGGPIGIALIGIAIPLSLALVWGVPWRFQRSFEILSGLGWIIGGAILALGLLSFGQITGKFRWVRFATVASLLGLAGTSLFLSIGQPRWPVDQQVEKAMFVLAVATTLGGAAIAILHRINTLKKRESHRTTALDVSLTCPRCTALISVPVGHARCTHCGLRIFIEVEEDLCHKCGYPLFRLGSNRCPECGTPIA